MLLNLHKRHLFACAISMGLMFPASSSFSDSFERTPGVIQSEWFFEESLGGMSSDIYSAYTETDVQQHNMVGEIGLTCLVGKDETRSVIFTFRHYEAGKLKVWKDEPYEIRFKSSSRKTGYVRIGATYMESRGAIANPLIVDKDAGDPNGLRLVVQELQGDEETYVYVSSKGKTKMGYMFTHKNAAQALSSVLKKCGMLS